MDEIFKINSPSQSTNNFNTKEIRLSDDEEDPFSMNDNNSKKSSSSNSNPSANINIQPVGLSSAPTASLAPDNQKLNEETTVKKSVSFSL
jgi:hypothetical protein